MDIAKIENLTALLKSAQEIRFEVDDDRTLKIKNNYHKPSTKQGAIELAQKLQKAIGPIVAEYEAELRKQLALCAKFKD